MRTTGDDMQSHPEHVSNAQDQSNPQDQAPSNSAGMPGDDEPTRFDRLLRLVSQIGVVVIAFIAGSLATTANMFPGTEIANAYKGGKALYAQATKYQDVYHTDLWYDQRTPERGVIIDKSGQTEPGLTLYTDGESATAFLIDAHGKVLHKWHRPFSTVWDPKRSSIKRPQPDDHVYFRKAIMYPNGDLLAVYEGSGDTPYGYGVVKLDKNSNVIWSYFGRAHHDIDVGPDGRIYVLTQGFVKTQDKDYPDLATPRLLDSLVILSPQGKVQKTIPLFKAVADTRYRTMLYTVSRYAIADPLHTNDVDVITPEMAKNFPYGKAGQILLSFRELAAVAVLDPESEKIVWAMRGPWIGQHDPDILPDGNILMFDNNGNYGDFRHSSRVLEVDPKTMKIVWEYKGTPDNPLGSIIRGAVQRLKNGNTLITESSGGRILEVTPSGEIVWEYVNPVRGGHPNQTPQIPIICGATYIDPSTIEPGVLAPQQLTQAAN